VTVKPGDTLSGIAAEYGKDWHKIYAVNKDTIGSDPNLIYPGQKLVVK
jgi:nucleoid-associated protein YgaU